MSTNLKLKPWQDDFIDELNEMTNREVFDLYVTMQNGIYWDEEEIEADSADGEWMEKEVEDELDYRLRDWYDADLIVDEEDPEDDPDDDEEFIEDDDYEVDVPPFADDLDRSQRV